MAQVVDTFLVENKDRFIEIYSISHWWNRSYIKRQNKCEILRTSMHAATHSKALFDTFLE